ncbi:hypothetical protein, partial [Gloeomargarita lithophora]|uniref:hypothetical protein n=1 Tax=Gloeomargarita lithophora TaxID=1188228 RepID=UPI001C12B54A
TQQLFYLDQHIFLMRLGSSHFYLVDSVLPVLLELEPVSGLKTYKVPTTMPPRCFTTTRPPSTAGSPWTTFGLILTPP